MVYGTRFHKLLTHLDLGNSNISNNIDNNNSNNNNDNGSCGGFCVIVLSLFTFNSFLDHSLPLRPLTPQVPQLR